MPVLIPEIGLMRYITEVSLAVYPAAGLLYYAPANAEIYVIDPKQPGAISRRVTYITEKATVGMQQLYGLLCGK